MSGPSHARRVLVCDPIHPDGLALLRQQAEVDEVGEPALTAAELKARIGDYDAVVVRSRTPLPAAAIKAGGRLRVIGRAGVGLDGIDVAAAEAQGVAVVNAPAASSVSVAEHTLALMLALARHVPAADRAMKEGRWAKQELADGVCLEGKTLGIVGFGRIGQRVARRAQGFDMRVLANQPRVTRQLEAAEDVEAVDLYDLLAAADFVSLHVPMRPENVGLIGAAELARMRASAYLINTSRGTIVDEAALLAALEAGQIAGAGLDVWANEPDANWRLAGHPRVVATPHLAASTEDAQCAAGLAVAEQIIARLT